MSSKKNVYKWDGVPFDKENEQVLTRCRETHRGLINQLQERMLDQEVKKSDLAFRIGGEAPQIYRVFNEKKNITIETMCRVASAVGARVKITLVEGDSE